MTSRVNDQSAPAAALGHRSTADTMATYGHLLPTYLNDRGLARLQLLEAVVTTAIAMALEGEPAGACLHLAQVFPDLAAAAEQERAEHAHVDPVVPGV